MATTNVENAKRRACVLTNGTKLFVVACVNEYKRPATPHHPPANNAVARWVHHRLFEPHCVRLIADLAGEHVIYATSISFKFCRYIDDHIVFAT